jgi:hypothetical protein
LRADPHKWGAGAIHLLDPINGKTICGKDRQVCPGMPLLGQIEEITCKGCIRSRETALKRAKEKERSQAESEERKRQKEELKRQWGAAYDAYLQTTTCFHKRHLVLKRDGGICQGCGETQARQIHHLSYPNSGCLPGSAEWIACEKLFDLVSVCSSCHDDLHTRPAATMTTSNE